MTFVFISSSAADQRFRSTAGFIRDTSQQNFGNNYFAAIRRPYRGIQIKQDTYATISIFDGRGRPIFLDSESSRTKFTDSGNVGKVDLYGDFILQSISDTRMEKHQIIETFGDSFVFFFGERPRMVTMRGILVNTEDFNWRSQFMSNYERFLRGTKLVQRNARAFISYDSIVLEGYPINVSAQVVANQPYLVNFEMTMFLTNYNDFSRIGVVDFPGTSFNNPQSRIDAMNVELGLDSARRPATVTAQVRLQNLLAAPSGATLSSSLREITKLTNTVFNFVDAIKQGALSLLSGRVITRPVGSAGFFAQIGQEGLVSTSSVSGDFLDIARARGLTKLRVPRRPQFVLPQILRSRFSENVDEYPLLEGLQVQPPHLYEQELTKRRMERKLIKENQRIELAAINLEAKGERDILRGIADVIRLGQAGFTMVSTAINVADGIVGSDDPASAGLQVVADAFGFSGVVGGQKRIVDSSAADASIFQDQGGGVSRLAIPSLVSEDTVTQQGLAGSVVGGSQRFGSPGSADASSATPAGGGVPRFPGAPG